MVMVTGSSEHTLCTVDSVYNEMFNSIDPYRSVASTRMALYVVCLFKNAVVFGKVAFITSRSGYNSTTTVDFTSHVLVPFEGGSDCDLSSRVWSSSTSTGVLQHKRKGTTTLTQCGSSSECQGQATCSKATHWRAVVVLPSLRIHMRNKMKINCNNISSSL